LEVRDYLIARQFRFEDFAVALGLLISPAVIAVNYRLARWIERRRGHDDDVICAAFERMTERDARRRRQQPRTVNEMFASFVQSLPAELQRPAAWRFSLADLLGVLLCAALVLPAFWVNDDCGVVVAALMFLTLVRTWWFLARQSEPICGIVRLAAFVRSLLSVAVAVALVSGSFFVAHILLQQFRMHVLLVGDPTSWSWLRVVLLGFNDALEKGVYVLWLFAFALLLWYKPVVCWSDQFLLAWNRARLDAQVNQPSANSSSPAPAERNPLERTDFSPQEDRPSRESA